MARLTRDGAFPGGIYWFSAENPDLRLQWARIAEELGAPALESLDERASWAVRELAHRAQRGDRPLLVLDNVETWAPPPAPLPDTSAVRLLVTTRARWLHNSFRAYEVQPLELPHGRQLLHAIVGREVPAADELLHALGGHVLSIELAATYLREYGTAPGEYLGQLLAGKSPGAAVADRTAYRATAESAFRMLWQRLGDDLRQAWLRAAQLPPEWFSTELADAIGIDAERRRGLVRLHILERDDRGRHQLHRLLREFALAEVPDTSSEHAAVVAGAALALVVGDPQMIFRRYGRDAACYQHLLETAQNGESSLALKLACGTALQQLGVLPGARMLCEQALAEARKLYGDDHVNLTLLRGPLARLRHQLGDLDGARQLFEQALAEARKHLGENNPVVATIRGNMAGLLEDLGDLGAARTLYEQALESDIDTYGEDHPEIAVTRGNLAGLLRQVGDLPAARRLYEQALSCCLRIHGEGHPMVAIARGNLGSLLHELGDLAAARRLYEQALSSDLETYGDDHPSVAAHRANLASLLRDLGDLRGARALLETALASELETYGGEHPTVARRRAQLGDILHKLGDLTAARALYDRALASDLEHHGDDHRDVATTRESLAVVVHELGDLPAARTLAEQILSSALRVYGDGHFKVVIARMYLAKLLHEIGDLAALRLLLAQASASPDASSRKEHPLIMRIRAGIHALWRRLGGARLTRS